MVQLILIVFLGLNGAQFEIRGPFINPVRCEVQGGHLGATWIAAHRDHELVGWRCRGLTIGAVG